MPQPNLIAPASSPPGGDDHAAGDCHDRRSGGRRVVDAEVRTIAAMDRMESASREARRNARLELERRLQHGPLQRPPFLVIEACLAGGWIHPSIRLILTAFVGEPRADDRAVVRELTVAHRLLEEQLELVAGLQVALKIDLPDEKIRQRNREVDVLARTVHRRDQRGVIGVNRSSQCRELGLLLVGNDLGTQRVGFGRLRPDDAEKFVGVDLVFELAQQAVERADETIASIRAQIARVEHVTRRLHCRLNEFDR